MTGDFPDMRKSIVFMLCAASMTAALAASWVQIAKHRYGDARRAPMLERPVTGARVRLPLGNRVPRAPVEGAVESPGSLPKLPPVSIRIAGDIETSGSETPMVIVRFGDQQVPATVNGNTFTADLARLNAASIVSIEVAKPSLQYRALLGSAQLLKRQAGANGVLEISENPSLRVSPISTAIHFFVSRELGGRLPTSDDEMDKALRALTAADLAPAANLQRVIVQGERQLPSGFTSATELLADREAYRQFLILYPEIRSGADAYLRSLPAGAFAASDLDRNWLLTTRIARNGAPFVQPTVQLMLRRPGGFAVSAGQSRSNPNFGAELLADGDLRITPEGQPYFDTMVIANQIDPTNPSRSIVRRATIQRETYRRLFVGKRQQLWLQTREESRNFPQYPAQPTVAAATSAMLNASVLEDAVVPVVEADVLGRRAIPYFCLQPSQVNGEAAVLQNCEFALHSMGANGFGQADGIGAKVDTSLVPASASGSVGVQWRLDAGTLRIDGPDTSAKYWRLGLSDGVADAMVFQTTAQSGGETQVLAGHTIVLNGNLPTFFGPTEPAGTWHYGSFDAPEEYGYGEQFAVGPSRFIRNTDGTGMQTSFLSAGFGEPAFTLIQRSGWKLIGLNLYDTRYRANIPSGDLYSQYFHSCEYAFTLGASQCAPTRVRYFRPVARLGSRWYGIEDIYSRQSITGYVAPFQFERSSRANYYDRL